MNKTKIDWCDMTFNPVTGCLHGCEYCYARRIANRFGGNLLKWSKYVSESGIYTIDAPLCDEVTGKIIPYPYKFEPTLHKYRLDEPSRKTKGQMIFVCSMADLFGEWVPDEWIKEVFKACEKAPQQTYLFLTKYPKRFLDLYDKKIFPYKENFLFGTKMTKPSDEYVWFERTPYKTFISIEPMLEPFGELERGAMPNWVIIGAETGNRIGKIVPKREWIESIITQCKAAGVPVFMKESLRQLMGQDFIQEWPEGMKP